MVRVVIPDDYQGAVQHLECFGKLAAHTVAIYRDTVRDTDTLVERFYDADALVFIRERTAITAPLLERLPNLRLISQTGKGIAHIDPDACTRHGVAVAVGGGAPYAPAELTWALILASMRRLLEVHMPELTDVEAARRIRHDNADVRVLVLTAYDEPALSEGDRL